MKVVFFGTDDFAKALLEHLLRENTEIVAIVTRVDKPKGRNKKLLPSSVKELVIQEKLESELHQPKRASSPEFVEIMQKLNPDLFIVVSYGEIMKQNLLDVPLYGAINVHPSLLPKFRGPSPIQSAVIEGEKETGVSIMEMSLEMDAGDLIKVVKTKLEENETYGELKSRLIDLSKKALLEVVKSFQKGEKIAKVSQDHSKATFTKKITPETCQINWTESVDKIHDLVRGANPKPGARCNIEIEGKKQQLKILCTKVVTRRASNKAPGQVVSFSRQEGIQVACKDGVLEILELQPESRKAMPAKVYLNGYSQPVFL